MAMIISESGMQFGEYAEEQVFQLEKSIPYKEKLKSYGIKSCEFILRRDNKLYFIEANSSCPKQITADTPEEKVKKNNEYIQEIVLKMRHSITLYASILLQRYGMENVSELLRETDISRLQMILVLVVKNAEKEWLIPFQDVFRRELRDELKIWRISAFSVINEATARERHFII